MKFKNFIALILSFLMFFSLSACNEQKSADAQTPSKVTENITPPTLLNISVGMVTFKEYLKNTETVVSETGCNTIYLSDEDAKLYPALSEALLELNKSNEKAALDTSIELKNDFLEMYGETPDGFSPTLHSYSGVNIRRADSSVLSILQHTDSYYGGAHGSHGVWGRVYDTKTGKELKLSDVVTDTTILPDMIRKELKRLYGNLPELFVTDFTEVAKDPDKYDWSLENHGITIYFQEYELASYAAGILSVPLPADIVCEEYRTPAESYATEIHSYLPLYIDIDGDGDLEAVSDDSYSTELHDDTIRINADELEYFEELNFSDSHSTYVRTRNGDHIIFTETILENDTLETHIFSLGKNIEKLGKISCGMHRKEDSRTILTNPDEFLMDTESGTAAFSLTTASLPEKIKN